LSITDESNTINLKLFPMYLPPPVVKAYHVPISTVKLSLLIDSNWDLTMRKVVQFIDGLNSVRRIAELSETEYELTRRCISHLLYYGCIILVDVFAYSNIYAPTPLLQTFIASKDMQNECAVYVATDGFGGPRPERADLCFLYASLRQGTTVKQWVIENQKLLRMIDVRRFIGFGIVKGFVYRVHKWCYRSPLGAVHNTSAAISTNGEGGLPSRLQRVSLEGDRLASELQLPPLPLAKYLDGRHCFDEISSELQISEKEIRQKLLAYGEVQIIHR
jgi:hypothetical protein